MNRLRGLSLLVKKNIQRLGFNIINTLCAPLITHIYIKLVEKRIFIVNSCSSAVKLFHAEEFTITFVYNVYSFNDMTFFRTCEPVFMVLLGDFKTKFLFTCSVCLLTRRRSNRWVMRYNVTWTTQSFVFSILKRVWI